MKEPPLALPSRLGGVNDPTLIAEILKDVCDSPEQCRDLCNQAQPLLGAITHPGDLLDILKIVLQFPPDQRAILCERIKPLLQEATHSPQVIDVLQTILRFPSESRVGLCEKAKIFLDSATNIDEMLELLKSICEFPPEELTVEVYENLKPLLKGRIERDQLVGMIKATLAFPPEHRTALCRLAELILKGLSDYCTATEVLESMLEASFEGLSGLQDLAESLLEGVAYDLSLSDIFDAIHCFPLDERAEVCQQAKLLSRGTTEGSQIAELLNAILKFPPEKHLEVCKKIQPLSSLANCSQAIATLNTLKDSPLYMKEMHRFPPLEELIETFSSLDNALGALSRLSLDQIHTCFEIYHERGIPFSEVLRGLNHFTGLERKSSIIEVIDLLGIPLDAEKLPLALKTFNRFSIREIESFKEDPSLLFLVRSRIDAQQKSSLDSYLTADIKDGYLLSGTLESTAYQDHFSQKLKENLGLARRLCNHADTIFLWIPNNPQRSPLTKNMSVNELGKLNTQVNSFRGRKDALRAAREAHLGKCAEMAKECCAYAEEQGIAGVERYGLLTGPSPGYEKVNVGVPKGDHVFLVIGRAPESAPSDYKTWGPDTVICDAWTGAFFPASQLEQYLYNHTGTANDFKGRQYAAVRLFDPRYYVLTRY